VGHSNTSIHPRGAAVRTPRYLYAEYDYTDGGRDVELYDLASDLYQLASRHDDAAFAERRAELAALLQHPQERLTHPGTSRQNPLVYRSALARRYRQPKSAQEPGHQSSPGLPMASLNGSSSRKAHKAARLGGRDLRHWGIR
jgi:hypothetical protein